jgi:RNA polymerase sigma-70 factor (ECF subfamily)
MSNPDKDLGLLLKKAQRGDKKSLEIICQELKDLMWRYFIKKFNDPNLVDDLSQETYLRLLKNIPKIKEPMRLKNFVLKVAFHVTQDYFRQKYRKNDDIFIDEHETHEGKNLERNQFVNQNMNSDYILSKLDLETAMEKLPVKTQLILQMRAEGYKYEEIAEALKISESGVKMQVKRGVEKLKNLVFNVTFLALKTIVVIVK